MLGALRPRRLAKLVLSQGDRLQRLLWAAEDASVFSAKFLAKVAVKAARPAIVCKCAKNACMHANALPSLPCGLSMLQVRFGFSSFRAFLADVCLATATVS